MVFKPLHLARQSFFKTFTHGYAQSLVAASQSSSASQNTSFQTVGSNVASLLSRGSLAQQQNAFQSSATSSGASAKVTSQDAGGTESGLAAYYAAWQKHRKTEEKDLHPFQFAKRVGWKAPTTIPDGPARTREASQRPAATGENRRATLTRSQTTTALDQLKASTELNPASTSDELRPSLEQSSGSVAEPLVWSDVVDEDNVPTPKASDSFVSTASLESSSTTASTKPSSVTSSHSYTEHLQVLAETQQYADIPAVFESMLAAGVTPSASAYNALLLAAINLPRGKHLVVSKVLDVYADMLRRHVVPDTSTYAILIELLAARAMDVHAMKHELSIKSARYGSSNSQGFLLKSDETEAQILEEDDALNVAIKLFDTSAAVSSSHIFAPETYRLLISACAETGRIGDMVRAYASLESHGVTAPSAVFPQMINAFASTGDLRSAVECYDVYKALAISNNDGHNSIVRKDEEVYAAVIRAYALCGRIDGGLQFLDKICAHISEEATTTTLRDFVFTQSVYPVWNQNSAHAKVLAHAASHLTPVASAEAFAAVCADAADKNLADTANAAFSSLLQTNHDVDHSEAEMALLAMHLRRGDLDAARLAWESLKQSAPSPSLVEATTSFALAIARNGMTEDAIAEAGAMFARIRDAQPSLAVTDRLDEAIEILASGILSQCIPSGSTSMHLLRMMAQNGRAVTPITEHVLASMGPEQVASLSVDDIKLLAQVEAGFINGAAALDVAHSARFSHVAEIITANGATFELSSSKMIEAALLKTNRPDLLNRWQSLQSPSSSILVPIQFPPSPAYTDPSVNVQEDFDPHAASTDFKGSNFIADELEKPHGSHVRHLQEALFRFRNMRRLGRHPRYATYAKLISAAAKENQLSTAEDVLAMARQDVPLLPHSTTVRNGWILMLDAMVAASLNTGHRDAAARHHHELLSMGAAPSANTFGLYITTLKEGTKTFDEATEAVKIFHQAKTEGVEPTSFLYNALIGKLGKARRIDDTLFYFAEMRAHGIRPTSVTYGTVVNALCRVSDDKFAEQLFEEMESCTNYKPRPAPYNSLMQSFLTTKRDRSKVLAYFERMRANHIQPTMHTYKLLIDTYATLTPVDLSAAAGIIDEIKAKGFRPEAVHYAALIHAKGCVMNDMSAARALFDTVISDSTIKPQPCLYQALFEGYVANHDVASTEPLLPSMREKSVQLTPYIANTLIHGWATAGDIAKARSVYDKLGREGREPSTYEAMTRAWLSASESGEARKVVGEALRRGYPTAVAGRIAELVAPQAEIKMAAAL
ncbi:MAG: hypothetical protein Q9159_002385 [Coniocarpon cinnabarinum]